MGSLTPAKCTACSGMGRNQPKPKAGTHSNALERIKVIFVFHFNLSNSTVQMCITVHYVRVYAYHNIAVKTWKSEVLTLLELFWQNYYLSIKYKL